MHHPTHPAPRKRGTLLVALGVLAGCQGVIGDGGPEVDPPDAGPQCTTLESPGAPVPMRRLTAQHVQRTVEAVLPSVEGAVPPLTVTDETIFTFRSNVSSAIDLLGARAYMDYAEASVAAADLSTCDQVDEACLGWLANEVAPRLFRRPLSAEETDRYGALFAAGQAQDGPREGARWVLESMLQSPSFLYLDEVTEADGYLDDLSVASRLALTIWGQNPDLALLDKALAGELSTPEQIEAEAERMLDDPRAVGGLTDFVDQWLALDRLNDPEARPDLEALGATTLSAMRDEPVQLFDMLVREGGDLEALLTTNVSPASAALESLYGDDIVSGDGAKVTLDPELRAGILSRPGVMAAMSHAEVTSPSVRGFNVLKNFLCAPPPPPPAGVAVTLPAVGPDATLRDKLEAHFSDPTCASCHAAMDGIGFTFERIDWLGRSRETDNGHPIDDAASFTLDGEPAEVAGVAEMAAALSESEDVARCLARQWVSYGAGVPDSEDVDCIVEDLAAQAQSEGGLRRMIIAFVTSDWFRRGPGVSP